MPTVAMTDGRRWRAAAGAQCPRLRARAEPGMRRTPARGDKLGFSATGSCPCVSCFFPFPLPPRSAWSPPAASATRTPRPPPPRRPQPAAAAEKIVDEHSYAEPDKVRTTDLALDLVVDFDSKDHRRHRHLHAGLAGQVRDPTGARHPRPDHRQGRRPARRRQVGAAEVRAGGQGQDAGQQADHRNAGPPGQACASPTPPRPRPRACSGWRRR